MQIGAIVRHCCAHAEGKAVTPADVEIVEALGWAAACEKRNAQKRREFEQRMERKARREGKPDDAYTRSGRVPPTDTQVAQLRALAPPERMAWWSARFGQHCLAFHVEGECERAQGEHGCAFLHVSPTAAAATEAPDVAPSWLREKDEKPEEAAAVADAQAADRAEQERPEERRAEDGASRGTGGKSPREGKGGKGGGSFAGRGKGGGKGRGKGGGKGGRKGGGKGGDSDRGKGGGGQKGNGLGKGKGGKGKRGSW